MKETCVTTGNWFQTGVLTMRPVSTNSENKLAVRYVKKELKQRSSDNLYCSFSIDENIIELSFDLGKCFIDL